MSADGTSLLSFADFVMATKPKKITPTTEVLNETAKNYYLLGDLVKGRGEEEIIQNGQKIIDMVRLSTHSAASFYKPNQNLQPRGMDVLTTLTANWRFVQGNYAWTDEQVNLNGGGSDNWVKLLKVWRDASRQDIWDLQENNLFSVPDNAEMEADTGTKPYSLMTFITEDGLAPTGFTTVMGVNPTTQANWRNQTESYTIASKATTLYPAFDRMWHKLNWNGPASKEEWFQSTEWRKFKILTTLNGIVDYLDLNRSNNDRLTPANDPGSFAANPAYNGIPLKRIPGLEDFVAAKGYTYNPYVWLDGRYVFPVYHRDVYMAEGDPIAGGVNQPFSKAVYTNTYTNLFARSRKRLGYIKGT